METHERAISERPLSELERKLVDRDLHRRVLGYARRLTQGSHYAEDIVQEARLRAWHRLSRFESRSELTTWVCSFVNYVAREYKKAEKIPPEVQIPINDALASASYEIEPEALLDARTQLDKLQDALDRMPEELRIPFLLFEIDGLSLREIGERLCISAERVKQRLHAARKWLKTAGCTGFVAALVVFSASDAGASTIGVGAVGRTLSVGGKLSLTNIATIAASSAAIIGVLIALLRGCTPSRPPEPIQSRVESSAGNLDIPTAPVERQIPVRRTTAPAQITSNQPRPNVEKPTEIDISTIVTTVNDAAVASCKDTLKSEPPSGVRFGVIHIFGPHGSKESPEPGGTLVMPKPATPESKSWAGCLQYTMDVILFKLDMRIKKAEQYTWSISIP